MKKLYSIILFSALVVGSIFVSCKKEGEDPSNGTTTGSTTGVTGADDLSWLAVNHEWEYDAKTTMYITVGGVTTDTTVDAIFSQKIISDLGSGKFLSAQIMNGHVMDSMVFIKEGTNLYINKYDEPLSSKELIYKTGLKVGDTFGPDSLFNEVLSVSEPVTVAAGTFTCIKVKSTDKRISATGNYSMWYFSTKYGMIKNEEFENNVSKNLAKLKSKNF